MEPIGPKITEGRDSGAFAHGSGRVLRVARDTVPLVSKAQAAACPCGSGMAYSRCCRPYHLGSAEAPTAEALMRSRYSAYVKRLPAYLRRTWHPDTCPADLTLEQSPRWEDLTVVRVAGGGTHDETGIVEFVARHDRGVLHEISTFMRIGGDGNQGRWVYLREQAGGLRSQPTAGPRQP